MTTFLGRRVLDASTRGLGVLSSCLAAAFLVVPVAVAVVLSFDGRSFLGPWPPPGLSLRWYRAFLAEPTYADGLVTSLQVVCVSTALATVFGTMAALAIAQGRFPGRAAIETALLSPKFIPTVVIGFGLLGLAARFRVDDALVRRKRCAGITLMLRPSRTWGATVGLVGEPGAG